MFSTSEELSCDAIQSQQLAAKIYEFCEARPREAYGFCEWIDALRGLNLKITDEIFALMVKHIEWKWQIQFSVKVLSLNSSALVTNENLKLLLMHPEYARFIVELLDYLYRVDPVLVNDENRQLLAKHAKDAFLLVGLLKKLKDTGLPLVNEKNFYALVNHLCWARELGTGLNQLNEAKLLSQASFDELLDFTRTHLSLGVCEKKDSSMMDLYCKLVIFIQTSSRKEAKDFMSRMTTFFGLPFNVVNKQIQATRKIIHYFSQKSVEFTEEDISVLNRHPLRSILNEYKSIIQIDALPMSNKRLLTP